MSLVNGILTRRQRLAAQDPKPVFVWEPVPDLCTPQEFDKLREAARLVDVVSPNAHEFVSFFTTSKVTDMSMQEMVEVFLGLGEVLELKTPLVVREGARGCTTYAGSRSLHLHAYHQSAARVLDPTGGGNTFLGALAIGMTGVVSPAEHVFVDSQLHESDFSKQRLILGLLHATVAASYSIEQTGMPVLSATDPNVWNGEAYQDRFHSFLARENAHIVRQLSGDRGSDPLNPKGQNSMVRTSF